MASPAPNTVVLICPKCGHEQREPRTAYSTVCRQCHTHIRVQEVLQPTGPVASRTIASKHVQCFQCGAELEVPVSAESTMCKSCSSYVDLQDYHISTTVSKNFRTYGRLVIEEKGYVLNTVSQVGDAVIKGRMIGKLVAERTLQIYSHASIKGTFSTACLIIPAAQHFWWPETIRVPSADIAGELTANLAVTGTVVLRGAGRLFGNIEAANLVVESGAVFVGSAKIGQSASSPAPEPVHLVEPQPKPANPIPRPRPKPSRPRPRTFTSG